MESRLIIFAVQRMGSASVVRRCFQGFGRLDGGQYDLQSEVDEVYVGYGDRDFANDYRSFVQDTVKSFA